jgi:hypothetical protein
MVSEHEDADKGGSEQGERSGGRAAWQGTGNSKLHVGSPDMKKLLDIRKELFGWRIIRNPCTLADKRRTMSAKE